jgi:hypothetical protein
VNLDGVNELALSYQENFLMGVNTTYPRAWRARTLAFIDPREYDDAFRLWELRAKRQMLAKSSVASFLRRTHLATLVWSVRDGLMQRERAELEQKLWDKHRQAGGHGFLTSGPAQSISGLDDVLASTSDLWVRCSIQLNQLLTPGRMAYLHVLQPNLHVAGSKVLTTQEQESIRMRAGNFSKPIREGYPALVRRGQELRGAGVRFLDLSRLFSDVSETVYSDDCGHFNEHGNAILTRAIAVELRELLESKLAE